jgi:hypothetical protein
MTAFPSYSTGTAAIGAGATSIVGTGSNWTAQNAVANDTFTVPGKGSIKINEVINATTLAIDAWPFGAITAGTAYNIKKDSPLRFAGGQVMADVSTVIAALNTTGFYVFVPAIATVPDPSYGDDGQYAFQAVTGKLWVKSSGTWNFVGIFKGFGLPAPWNSATAYNAFDVATLNGSSYVCILANTNQTPPNATYWTVLAAKGDTGATGTAGTNGATGPAAWKPPVAWATGVAMVSGPPATVVTQAGETYVCLIPHTSGTFATDLAAGRWLKVAQKGSGDMLSSNFASEYVGHEASVRANLGMSTEIGKIEWWPTTTLQPGRLKANGQTVSRTTYPLLYGYLVASGTATFTNGSSNVGMANHNRSVGDPIKLFTTVGLPTNFAAGTHGLPTVGTNYFIKSVVDANTVTLSATVGGTAISAGSAGSGTHTWVNAPHGDGDGSTTFSLPDMRGNFARGWNDNASVDANRTIGDLQLDAMQGHIHSVTNNANYVYVRGGGGLFGGLTPSTDWDRQPLTIGGPVTDGTNGTPRTAAETRPRNVSLLATIRYAA